MENRETIIKRKQFFTHCPLCKQEIKGSSESQVEYNLKTHTQQKHDLIKKEVDKDFMKPLKAKYRKNKNGVEDV